MFYYVSGILAHREPGFAVIDCGGVGYRLTVSQNTLAALDRASARESKVKLYTYMAVREDDVELFGFYTEEELTTFRQLIGVSGIGPKAAMGVLSAFTPDGLARAVCTEDVKAIAKSNGVGAKGAARIVLELKDKMSYTGGDAETPRETAAARADGKVRRTCRGGRGTHGAGVRPRRGERRARKAEYGGYGVGRHHPRGAGTVYERIRRGTYERHGRYFQRRDRL